MAESLEERCGAVLQTRDFDDGFPQYECTHPAGHLCAHTGPNASWTDAEHWIPCEVEDAIERRVRAEERQRYAALEEAARRFVDAWEAEMDAAHDFMDRGDIEPKRRASAERGLAYVALRNLAGKQKAAP